MSDQRGIEPRTLVDWESEDVSVSNIVTSRKNSHLHISAGGSW